MSEKYTGTWDSVKGFPDGVIPGTFPGLIPGVFTINADGSGNILLLGNVIPCDYQFSEGGKTDKMKLTVPGIGECIFDVEIYNDNFFLSNASADKAGTTAGLPIYALLSPYSKAR